MKFQNKTIGKWTCPSGNRVDAVFEKANQEMKFFWDEPPRDPQDQAYYYKVIRPQAVMKALPSFHNTKNNKCFTL